MSDAGRQLTDGFELLRMAQLQLDGITFLFNAFARRDVFDSADVTQQRAGRREHGGGHHLTPPDLAGGR